MWLGGNSEPGYERGARLGDGFIFAADGEDSLEQWARVKHHLGVLGRPEEGFGRELLAIFARNRQEAADHLKRWRDAGGTHGTVPSMDKGLGGDINAHVDYVADVKRLLDAG